MVSRVKKILGAVTIAAGLLFCSPAKSETADVSLDISTSVKNAFVALNGPTMVDNPVNQSYVGLNTKVKNVSLTNYIWMNYDLKEEKATEIDFSTKINFPEFELGKSKITGQVGYELWTYPNTEPYVMDPAGVLSLSFLGPVDANITIKKLLIKEGDKGYQTTGNLSKHLDLYTDKEINVSATPNIGAAHLIHFFGGNGWSYVRTGGSVNASHKGWNLGLSAEWQHSLDDEISENKPIYGLSIGKTFK